MSAAWLLVVITAVNVVIAGIYAWLTHRIAKSSGAAVSAMREQTEVLLRPYVTIRPYFPPGFLVLCLKVANTGRSTAHRLKLRLDKDFYLFDRKTEETNLRKRAAFSDEIDCFPPGAELNFELTPGWKAFSSEDDDLTPAFTITATYEHSRKKYEEKTTIDPGAYAGTSYPYDPVQKELEGIRKALEKIDSRLGSVALAEPTLRVAR